MPGFSAAITTPVGSLAASSLAKDGPEERELMVQLSGSSAARIASTKVSDSFSMPFVALTIGAVRGTLRATSCATSRVAWLGATKTTMDAPDSASSGLTVAVSVAGSSALGR